MARILADTEADYLRARIVVGGLTTVVALGGYLLVIGVIRRVELLSEERAAVAGANVATPAATGPIRAAGYPAPASSASVSALPAATEPAAPAAIRPTSNFAAGRTVEFLAQRGSTASPGTTAGAADEAGSTGLEPGNHPPDEPRRPA